MNNSITIKKTINNQCNYPDEEVYQSTQFLEALYKKSNKYLFNQMMKMTGYNYDLSQDLISTTFLSFTKAIHKNKAHPNPLALLLRIAKNKYIDYLRKEQISKKTLGKYLYIDLERTAFNAEEEWIMAQQINILHYCLKELPVHYRELIVWKYFEKKTCKTIAILSGKSQKAVACCLERAIALLKKIFTRYYR